MHDHFRELQEHVCSTTRRIGGDFTKPDDDWAPIGFMQGPNGHDILPLYEVEKDIWVPIIVSLIKETGAKQFAMVSSTWMVKVPYDKPDSLDCAPSEHPDREERLMVVVYDAERSEVWIAPIERHEDAPPTLGEWEAEKLPGLSGRIHDPIVAALR